MFGIKCKLQFYNIAFLILFSIIIFGVFLFVSSCAGGGGGGSSSGGGGADENTDPKLRAAILSAEKSFENYENTLNNIQNRYKTILQNNNNEEAAKDELLSWIKKNALFLDIKTVELSKSESSIVITYTDGVRAIISFFDDPNILGASINKQRESQPTPEPTMIQISPPLDGSGFAENEPRPQPTPNPPEQETQEPASQEAVQSEFRQNDNQFNVYEPQKEYLRITGKKSATVGNNRAIIYQGVSNRFRPFGEAVDALFIQKTYNKLKDANFEVTWIKPSAPISELKKAKEYSIVYIVGHGSTIDSKNEILIFTIGTNTYLKDIKEEEKPAIEQDLIEGRLVLMQRISEDMKSLEGIFPPELAITDYFFDYYCDRFPKTIMLLASCSTMAQVEQHNILKINLAKKGLAAVFGTAGLTSNISVWLDYIIEKMAGGATVKSAFDDCEKENVDLWQSMFMEVLHPESGYIGAPRCLASDNNLHFADLIVTVKAPDNDAKKLISKVVVKVFEKETGKQIGRAVEALNMMGKRDITGHSLIGEGAIDNIPLKPLIVKTYPYDNDGIEIEEIEEEIQAPVAGINALTVYVNLGYVLEIIPEYSKVVLNGRIGEQKITVQAFEKNSKGLNEYINPAQLDALGKVAFSADNEGIIFIGENPAKFSIEGKAEITVRSAVPCFAAIKASLAESSLENLGIAKSASIYFKDPQDVDLAEGGQFIQYENIIDKSAMNFASKNLLGEARSTSLHTDLYGNPFYTAMPYNYLLKLGAKGSCSQIEFAFSGSSRSFREWELYYTTDEEINIMGTEWRLAGFYNEGDGFKKVIRAMFPRTPSGTTGLKWKVYTSSGDDDDRKLYTDTNPYMPLTYVKVRGY